jgi:hypothetical protein
MFDFNFQKRPEVELTEAIVIRNHPRGDGTQNNPHRFVIQVWTPTGELIAEDDPYLKVERKSPHD